MTKCIVDLFESVKINHEQGKLFIVALRMDDSLVQSVKEERAIGQVSQCIMQGLIANRFLLLWMSVESVTEPAMRRIFPFMSRCALPLSLIQRSPFLVLILNSVSRIMFRAIVQEVRKCILVSSKIRGKNDAV